MAKEILTFFLQPQGTYCPAMLTICYMWCIGSCKLTLVSWVIYYSICIKTFCKGSMNRLKNLGKP
ncbi:hypothetical protein MKW94_012251 [Papaver nudicaule]|uniref:Uncharacterized protein n=1 Tax=Papaver nudicaule TaxID=74823 RepID=A0AA41V4M1_PAPNU|nr:hypothetical protein [Papaver nudicaule]